MQNLLRSVREIQQNRVIILIKYTHGGFSIMRHLLSPLDLSVDELARLLDLARDISKDPSKYGQYVMERRLPHCSMSQVLEQD